VPAEERFDSEDSTVGKGDLRLIENLKLPSFESVAHSRVHLQLLQALHADAWSVDLRAVASAVLDAIHGEVGVLEEAVDIIAAGKEADAYARGNNDLVFSDANRLGDGGQKLLGDLCGIFVGAKVGE